MFDVDDIRDWVGLAVVDQEGSKIGSLEAVYYDTSTDEAKFGTVKVGFPGGGRLIFVPLDGARVSPKALRVQTTKKVAKTGPGHRHRRSARVRRRSRRLRPLRPGLRTRGERRAPPRPPLTQPERRSSTDGRAACCAC